MTPFLLLLMAVFLAAADSMSIDSKTNPVQPGAGKYPVDNPPPVSEQQGAAGKDQKLQEGAGKGQGGPGADALPKTDEPKPKAERPIEENIAVAGELPNAQSEEKPEEKDSEEGNGHGNKLDNWSTLEDTSSIQNETVKTFVGCLTEGNTDYRRHTIPNTHKPGIRSASGCCNYCRKVPGCKAWTFVSKDSGYNYHGCYPKSSIMGRRQLAKHVSGIVMHENTASCTTEGKYLYKGYGLASKYIAHFSSTEDCCTYCKTLNGCKYWSWKKDTGKCRPKKSNAGRVPNHVWVSGTIP